MGATAVFDAPTFKLRYPEFATVDAALLGLYANEATLYLANDGSGPVQNAGQQLSLLNMVVAHIAKINATVNGQAPSGLVGRVSSASEGSVSVSVEGAPASGSSAWFMQTTYGAQFWAATAPYRTARYIPSYPQGTFPSGFLPRF